MNEPKVSIYLNDDDIAWVIFSDVLVKDRYVIDEMKYCRKQEDAYKLARHKKQRDTAKKELLAKRVEFAYFSGYKPSLKDPTRFVFDGTKSSTPPPRYA